MQPSPVYHRNYSGLRVRFGTLSAVGRTPITDPISAQATLSAATHCPPFRVHPGGMMKLGEACCQTIRLILLGGNTMQ
jgi:hypothetical protein